MSERCALFCADPLRPRAVDPGWAAEAEAARDHGFAPVVLDHDALDHGIDPAAAPRPARLAGAGVAVCRGWMLRAEAYAALHAALPARGVRLLTDPAAYEACHHAPASHAALGDLLPRTTWVAADALDAPGAIEAALAPFGGGGVIVKDWVKSQAAGCWSGACLVPRADDTGHARRVIARLRELQGDALVGGVVLKAYLPLVPLGRPVHEQRMFVAGGRVVGCWPRAPKATVLGAPPGDLLKEVARRAPSPFASVDFAVDEAGRWRLLEVGDGQVSGLPSDDAAEPLFAALAGPAAEVGG